MLAGEDNLTEFGPLVIYYLEAACIIFIKCSINLDTEISLFFQLQTVTQKL